MKFKVWITSILLTLALLSCAGAEADAAADAQIDIRHDYGTSDESVVVTATLDGSELWSYTSVSETRTELDMVNTFEVDGARHIVLINNAYEGKLTALDAQTGAELWTLDGDFGASNAFAQGDDAVYITGYYGPDAPVAVSLDGDVLWEAALDDSNMYWPYEITCLPEGIKVSYEMLWLDSGESENGGWALFAYADGALLDSGEYSAYSRAFDAIAAYQSDTAGASLKCVIAAQKLLDGLYYTNISSGEADTAVAQYIGAFGADEKAEFLEKYAEVAELARDIVANGLSEYADEISDSGAVFAHDDYGDTGFDTLDSAISVYAADAGDSGDAADTDTDSTADTIDMSSNNAIEGGSPVVDGIQFYSTASTKADCIDVHMRTFDGEGAVAADTIVSIKNIGKKADGQGVYFDAYELADGSVFCTSVGLFEGGSACYKVYEIDAGIPTLTVSVSDPGYSSGLALIDDITEETILSYDDAYSWGDYESEYRAKLDDMFADYGVRFTGTAEIRCSKECHYDSYDDYATADMSGATLLYIIKSIDDLPELSAIDGAATAPDSGNPASAGSIVTTGNVNLRSSPNLSGKSLDVISKGNTLKYLGESSVDERGVTWYKVSADGETGWVSSKYAKLQ